MLVWEDGYFKVKGNLPANYPAGVDPGLTNRVREAAFKEEQESALEVLRDWMSGD